MTEAAAVWAILDTYDYEPVEVMRETKRAVFYRAWNRDRTQCRERKSLSALPWRGPESDARIISGKLISARAERNRRVTAANVWFSDRARELTAQAIEARRAETVKQGSVADESAVAESDAHKGGES